MENIKFTTDHSDAANAGTRRWLRGESNGNYAHRKYLISGPFQTISMRRARRLIIKEFEMQKDWKESTL